MNKYLTHPQIIRYENNFDEVEARIKELSDRLKADKNEL